VVATSRSGGVFNYYGLLTGDNYSIYIETSLGTAVMQYADASVAHAAGVPLTEPEPIRKDLPAGLRPTRVIIACVLDRSGVLKDMRILEPGAAETTSKILAALPSWKFRPAMRGNEPVEVNAINARPKCVAPRVIFRATFDKLRVSGFRIALPSSFPFMLRLV